MINKKAYAKINLGLEVKSKRVDHYHNLKTIMMKVDLYDELFFEENGTIKLITDLQIPLEDNLIFQAAKLLKDRYNIIKGCKITLRKHLPLGAGLAGGSSDAAATLEGLNQLWNLNLSINDLFQIGSKLGSDVPFCILKRPAILEGRGQVLNDFIDIPEMYFILVLPDFSCSTKEIFTSHKLIPSNDRFNNLFSAIKSKNIKAIGKSLFNDLEVTVEKLLGKSLISDVKKKLIESGCYGAIMSGSGSTVVGIIDNYENAQNIKEIIEKSFPKYRIKVTKSYI